MAADAPGGIYTCRDWALIDGEPMVDESDAIIYETKTILVPENYVTGGGNITNGEKGKNRVLWLTFGGNAGYLTDGSLVGHWSFNWARHDRILGYACMEVPNHRDHVASVRRQRSRPGAAGGRRRHGDHDRRRPGELR